METNHIGSVIFSPQAPQQRSIIKIVLKIFAVIAVLMLIAGVGVAILAMRANPENVVQTMMSGLASVETSEINTDFSISLDLKDPIKNPYANQGINLPTEIKKVLISTTIHQMSDVSHLSTDGTKAAATFGGDISVNDEQMLKASLEMRMLNKHVYTRLARAEVAPAGFAIEQTKWFDLDTTSKNPLFSSLPVSLPSSTQMTQEQLVKARAAISQAKFIHVKEDKGIEWFGIVPVHHYIFTVDVSGVKQYLNELAKISGATEGGITGTNSDVDSQLQKMADEVVPAGDIWVTVFGQLPYRARVPFSFDSILAFFGQSFAGSHLSAVLTMNAVSVNKPVVIEVPQGIMSIEEFLKPITQSLDTARSKGADAAVKANLSNMRAQAELWYDANGNRYARKAYPLGPCPTFAFGNDSFFSDGQTMRSFQSIYSAIGGATNTACAASSKAWAAASKLPSGGNSQDQLPDAYCVDSKGTARAYNYSSYVKPTTLVDVIDPKTIACR